MTNGNMALHQNFKVLALKLAKSQCLASPPIRNLTIRPLQISLLREVYEAIEEVLKSGGFTQGRLFIGPSPIFQESVFALWMPSAEVSYSETIPRASLADANSARLAFRVLAAKWSHFLG